LIVIKSLIIGERKGKQFPPNGAITAPSILTVGKFLIKIFCSIMSHE
jgi:hypothetical protein